MRRLNMRRRKLRGVSLIELMVCIIILAVLAALATPWMGDFYRNGRLREAANSTHAMLLNARTEALKRDGQVVLQLDGSRLDLQDAGGTSLRSFALPAAVVASAVNAAGVPVTQIVFGGAGRTVPFGSAYLIDLVPVGMDCHVDEARCPRIVVRSGGAVKLCSTQAGCL